jgi:hypothetical protein
VARDHWPVRGRLRRRVLALGAFAAFAAGMLVAIGLGDVVRPAAEVAAAAIAAAAALRLLWRLRPWRVAPRAVILLRRAAVGSGSFAARQARALPRRIEAFTTREPWRPPAAFDDGVTRARRALGALVARTVPVRRRAHAELEVVALRATVAGAALGRRAHRRLLRSLTAGEETARAVP